MTALRVTFLHAAAYRLGVVQRRAQRMRGWVAVVAALAVTTLGVAVPPAAADTCGRTPSGIGPRTAPSGLARQQPSLDVALAGLPFRPVVPRSFGRPFRIWVRAGEPRFRSLGLVYRRSEREWFQVSQSRSTTARAVQEAFARDVAQRDPCGFDARLARLAGGSLALVIVAPDRVVVNFRRGGLDFQVLGSRALGRREVVRLANVLAASS